MDLIDRGIIAEIIGNCRISYRKLGKLLGLSAASVQRRVTKLKKSGIVSRPYVCLSHAMLDVDWCFAEMETDATESDEALFPQLGANPAVISIARLDPHKIYAAAFVSGSIGLYNMGRFLRGFQSVQNVEIQYMHPVSLSPLPPHEKHIYRGKTMKLAERHLTVLRNLIHDARMPASDIAQRTTYSSRRVQQIIRELQESGGFYFTHFLKFSAAGIVPFWINIYFDETTISPRELVEWVGETIPSEYWNAFLFSNQPRIMHFCTAKNIRRVAEITSLMKDSSSVERVESYVVQPQHHFVGPAYIRLAEMLRMNASNHLVEYYEDGHPQ
ncbi:MAG: winged helix-turn-helix transcriptional regulator [Candidatus Thorarchaeota archaeon]